MTWLAAMYMFFVTPRQHLTEEGYHLAESPLVSNYRTQVLLPHS
jgi:hypothetical protein